MLILPVVFLLLGVGTTLLTPAPQVVSDALVAFGTIFMHTWFDFSHLRAPAPAPAPTGPEPVTSLSLYRPFVLPPPPPPTKLPFFSPTAVLRFIRPAPLASARLVIRDTPTGYIPVPAAYAHGPYELPQFSTCVLHALEQAAPLIILALVSAVIFRLTIIQKFTSFESRNAKERASMNTDALALSTQDTSSDESDSVDTLVAEAPEVFTIVEGEQPAAQVLIDQVVSSNPASPVTSPVQKPVDLEKTPKQATNAEATVPIAVPEMNLDNVEQAPEDEDEVFLYPGADIVDVKSDATGIDVDTTSINVDTGIDADISDITADISGISSDVSSIAADTSGTTADTTEISTDPADTPADVQRSSPAAADKVPACPSLTGPPIPPIGVDDNVPAHDSLLVDDNFPASDATPTVCADDNVPAHDDREEPAPAPVSASASVAVVVSESAPVSEAASAPASEPAYLPVSERAYAPVSAPASAPRSAPTAFLDLPARPASVPPRSVPMPDDISDSDDEFSYLLVAHVRQNTARRSSSVPAARPSADAHSDSAAGTELDRDDMHIASAPVTHVAASDDAAVSVPEDVPVIVADDAATTTEDQSTSALSDTNAPAIDAAQTSTDEVNKDEDDVFVYPLDAPTPSDSTTADAPAQEEVRNDKTIGTIDLTTPVRSSEFQTTDFAPECSRAARIHAVNEEAAKDTRKYNGTQKTVVAPQQAAEPPKSLNPAQMLAARGQAIHDLIKATPSTQVPKQQVPVRGRGLNDSIWADPKPKQPEAGPSTRAPRQQTPLVGRSLMHARLRPSAPEGHHPVDITADQSPDLPPSMAYRPPRGVRGGKGKGKGKAANSEEESSSDGESTQHGDSEAASTSGQVASGSSLNPLAPVFVCPSGPAPGVGTGGADEWREPATPESQEDPASAVWAYMERCGLLRPTDATPTGPHFPPQGTVVEAVGPRLYANRRVQRRMACYYGLVLVKDWRGELGYARPGWY